MAPYKKSEITVYENASPFSDSMKLRSYNRAINAKIFLKSVATHLSFVSVNYHSHTIHVNPLFNNSLQAHLKLLIKAKEFPRWDRSYMDKQVDGSRSRNLTKVDISAVQIYSQV